MWRWLLVSILMLIAPKFALALVNINTASVEELDTIPGVGTSTAQKIIEARPFATTEDIMRVSGIGPATYEKLKDYITVSGQTDVVLPDENSESIVTPTARTSLPAVSEVKKVIEPKVTGFTISAPAYAYVNQKVEFDAVPSVASNVHFTHTWNFGDGTSERLGKPVHVYNHPGVYVVVVESLNNKDTFVSRTQIEILPINISITDFGDKVTITNNSDKEVDLSGMKLLRIGGEFIFPSYSLLLPKTSITISLFGNGEVSLFDQSGRLVAFSRIRDYPETPVVTSRVATSKVKVVSASQVEMVVEEEEEGEKGASEARALTVPATSSPDQNKNYPYLALIGVVFLALIIVYGTVKK